MCGFGERRGNVVTFIRSRHCDGLMELVGWIYREYQDRKPAERPEKILVDVIGMGGGVVDRLKELELPVVGVNVQDTALSTSEGVKLRDSLWLEGKIWLESNVGSLPNDPELEAQLVLPQYTLESRGKVKVESKKDMRTRTNMNLDKADTFLLSFAVPAAIMSGGTRNIRTPLRRKLVTYG